MESEFKEDPYRDANIISKFFFAWCVNLINFIEKKDPNSNYLFETSDKDNSQILGDILQLAWEAEKYNAAKHHATPSLYRAIKKLYLYKRFTVYCVLASLGSFCFFRPLVVVIVAYLALLVAYKKDDYLENASHVVLIVWLILFSLISFIINQHVTFNQMMEGLRIKTGIYSLLYKHVLASTKNKFEAKPIENVALLIGKIGKHLENLVQSWQHLITAPVIVVADTLYLYIYLGSCCFVGIGFLIFLAFLMHASSFFFATPYSVQLEKQRAETKSTLAEVVSGLETIKMNCMEARFEKLLLKHINSEMMRIVRTNIQNGLFYVLHSAAYLTSIGLTLLSTTLKDKVLTTDKVIVIVMFYYTIANLVLYEFPVQLVTLWRCMYSMRKMDRFLMTEGKTDIDWIQDPKNAVVLANVTSLPSQHYTTIAKVSLEIPHGCLCVITGGYNSGKNTIIPLLTEYVGFRTGSIQVSGEMAIYKSDSSFIEGTLKDNITLHRETDEEDYKTAKQLCGLGSEFKKYPTDEDSPMVKDQLSVEERAKILLARMLCRPADIFLFDHPPVDVRNSVRRRIFQSIILMYLGNATRIIVTSEKEYLERADLVVIMKDGCIDRIGAYGDMQDILTDITLLDIEEIDTYTMMHLSITPGSEIYLSNHHLSELGIREAFMKKLNPKEYQEKIAHSFYNVTKLRKFELFLLALGTAAAVLISATITLFILHKGNQNLFIFFNSTTIHLYGLQNLDNLNMGRRCIKAKSKLTHRKLYYFTALATIYIFVMLARLWLFVIICHSYMSRLYRNMVKTLLYGQADCLNKLEKRRLLAVFTEEFKNIVDYEPQQMMIVMEIVFFTLVVLGILGITMKWYAISLVFLLLTYWLLARKLYSITKKIRKLQVAVREKLRLHMETTFQDISIIHIVSVHEVFTKHFTQYNNLFRSVMFVKYSMLLAFQVWVNLICIAWYCWATVKQLISKEKMKETFLCTYFVLCHVLIVQFVHNEACRRITAIARTSRSMRRIQHYLSVGKFEKTSDLVQLPIDWGNVGQLDFALVTTKSLKRTSVVNITIDPGQKIGIIGKSDFGRIWMLSLLRINNFDGTILMDGVDIKKVDLRTLRSKISYISDESFVFSMSIRINLDPLGKFTDDQLWHALNLVQIRNLFSSLDAPITSVYKEGFSTNIMVMIHLARAILVRNRILILDDVHKLLNRKNIDLINQLIKAYFSECTVIKVSKSLYDMMDCERVMLISKGYIIEDNTPEVVMRKIRRYLYD